MKDGPGLRRDSSAVNKLYLFGEAGWGASSLLPCFPEMVTPVGKHLWLIKAGR
jgi:hypothetical protein